jgi:ABC-type spermidine/putrescine transport system permease subunit II
MDRLPEARVVPGEHLARLRAAAAHAGRALRRTWARIAQQVLVLALTAVGFAGVLAMTFVLAEHAITVHPIAATPEPRPMVIYFMKQPSPHPARAAMATLGAAQATIESAGPQ